MLGYTRIHVLIWMSFLIYRDVMSTYVEVLHVKPDSCTRSSTSKPIYFNDQVFYEILLKGTTLPGHCTIVFKGDEAYTRNGAEYRVCAGSINYNVSDCKFRLRILQGKERTVKLQRSCGAQPIRETCTDGPDLLQLEFINTTSTKSPNEIHLYVMADRIEKEKNVNGVIIAIILGVVLSIVFMVLASVALYFRLINRRRVPQIAHSTFEPITMTESFPNGHVMYDDPFKDMYSKKKGEDINSESPASTAQNAISTNGGESNTGFDPSDETADDTTQELKSSEPL